MAIEIGSVNMFNYLASRTLTGKYNISSKAVVPGIKDVSSSQPAEVVSIDDVCNKQTFQAGVVEPAMKTYDLRGNPLPISTNLPTNIYDKVA
jgi:hypothetical protein